MRVLMATHPGLGHLHPLAPVAGALESAGHQVAFACADSFRPRVEHLGFEAHAAGLDWLESDAERYLPQLAGVDLEAQPTWFLTHLFADEAAHRMVPDLLSLCERWQPDLLVRTDYEFATFVVAERLDLPYATVGLEMAMPSHVWTPQIGNQLAYLRRRHGLPPKPERDMFYRYLYLAYGPACFQFPGQSLPRTHYLRPQSFDRSEKTELPGWAATLPERPTIFATLGTVFNDKPAVFEIFIEALGGREVNVLLALGPGQDPDRLAGLPENFFVEDYIPMSLILPRCDLAITHGGHQTTLTVLAQGLPMIAVPLTATDPLRARRCVDLGVGVALKLPDIQFLRGLDFESLTAQTLADAVERVLGDSSYRERARAFQAECQSLPGMQRAVELLAAVAAGDEVGAALQTSDPPAAPSSTRPVAHREGR